MDYRFLSRFKKIDANRDHTVMRSPEGHLIHLAHKTLNKGMREALRQLPIEDQKAGRQEVLRMAQGGVVPEPEETTEQKRENVRGIGKAIGESITDMGAAYLNNPFLQGMNKIGGAAVDLAQNVGGGLAEGLGIPAAQAASPAPVEAAQEDFAPFIPQAAPQAPEAAPAAPPVDASALTKQYDAAIQGAEQKAKVEAAAATTQANVLTQAALDYKKVQDREQQYVQAAQDYGDKIWGELKDVPMESLSHNRSLGNRLLSAVGVMLGGGIIVGAVNQYIDQEVNNQRSTFDNKRTLYKMNYERLGNAKQAFDMTKLNLLQKMELDLKAAMQKGVAQSALPGVQKNLLDLQAEKYKLQQSLAKEQIAKEALQQAQKGASPERLRSIVDNMSVTDPERAKDLRGRLTPAGFADTADDAKEVKGIMADSDTSYTSIDRLLKIANTPGASVTPRVRAEAQSLVATLLGSLNKPLTGGGPMSESEREIVQSLAKDPTRIWSLGSQNIQGLQTLKQFVQRREANALKSKGLNPRSSSFTPRR